MILHVIPARRRFEVSRVSMSLSRQNLCCGRELERRQLRLGLALHCPRLESNGQDSAGHDKSREAHAHGEGEHGVQLVVLDGLDNGAGLQKIVSLSAFSNKRDTRGYLHSA